MTAVVAQTVVGFNLRRVSCRFLRFRNVLLAGERRLFLLAP